MEPDGTEAGRQAAHLPGAAMPGTTGFRRLLLAGAPLWGLAMVASLAIWQWHANRWLIANLGQLSLYFFAGGVLGWIVSLPIARSISRHRRPEYRLAACFLGLTLGTTGFTALLYAIQYRTFYAQWHDPFLTVTWCIQLVTTFVVALYQFSVLGVPNFLPLALPLGLAVSFALAKRMR